MRHSLISEMPTGPFASDPNWREWWWWLGIPVAIVVSLITLFQLNNQLYLDLVHPEGFGVLELSHFFVPLAGFFIALMMVFDPWVRARPLVFLWFVVMGMGCFYIAGEEQSWGQHFFKWATPDSWSELNTQNETNLHNVSDVFGKFPRTVLELGIMIGGVALPLMLYFRPERRKWPISFILPAAALMPTALLVLSFKLLSIAHKSQLVPRFATRPSEITETFIYMFILFYLIVLWRRVTERKMPTAGTTAA